MLAIELRTTLVNTYKNKMIIETTKLNINSKIMKSKLSKLQHHNCNVKIKIIKTTLQIGLRP